MSLDLVSKALDLDLDSAPIINSKKKTKSSSKDAMQLIKTDRQGVWKELRKLQKAHKKDVVAKRKTKKFKSAIETYREQNDVDNTEANVEALLRMTELGKVGDRTAQKILYEQPNRLSRDIKVVKEKKEKSVFTEKDFADFAKAYKAKTVKKK